MRASSLSSNSFLTPLSHARVFSFPFPYPTINLPMPKHHKPFAALPMLKEAWLFFWKQPALLRVSLWMMALTGFFSTVLGRVADTSDKLSTSSPGIFLAQNDPDALFVGFMGILLALVALWGECGMMVVGRRMIGARSGRTRTSFSSVLKEAAPFVRPVLFCELVILAMIAVPIFVLWAIYSSSAAIQQIADTPNFGLLFLAFVILTGLIAGTYLIFGPISIVCDDKKTSRGALRYSIALVRGKFWTTLKCLIIFGFLAFLPAMVTEMLIENVPLYGTWLILSADFLVSVLMGLGTAIAYLAIVLLYGKLRDAPKEVKL